MSALQTFNQFVKSEYTQNHLATVLGERRQQFVTSLTTLVSNDAKLQVCEPTTLMHAAITAAALDLPIEKGLGFAYVIPYKNRSTGITEAQFQIGYKGIIQLAIRSKQFVRINASDVREGEFGGVNRLTGDVAFNWDQTAERDQKPVVGYVAFFRLANGFSKTLYMSRDEVLTHAQRYSQTYSSKNDYIRKSSKWSTDFDAMATKTVLKRLLSKYAPLSVDMQTAFQADQSVQRQQGEYTYVDNDRGETRRRLAEVGASAAIEDAEATETTDETADAPAPMADELDTDDLKGIEI